MLKRPSQRRRSRGIQEIDLPLVPIMDAFVTLIAFLLMATSLLAVTLIDTPVPILSSLPDENKDKPLTLTVKISNTEIKLESPFNLIQPIGIPIVDKASHLDKLHATLMDIKKKFPKEHNIIFMPSADVKYEDIVQLMDASRAPSKTDETIFLADANGVGKPVTELFPDVIFGNIVSGTGSESKGNP